MPRTAGKWVFYIISNLEMATRSSKSRSSKMAKCYFLGHAHPHLCVFDCGTWILQKNVLFDNRPNFVETTENVVPKWRGRKRNFCTGGSETGHLRSGSKMVPKDFSFHCTSLPIHLHVHKENCLVFLATSPLDNRSLCIIFND